MSIDPTIFKAYDIRGNVGENLTLEGALAIGKAVAKKANLLGLTKLVLGWDSRASSVDLATAFKNGATSQGIDIISIGPSPTPLLYFATRYLKINAGVMVTGSHLPLNYNGFKIILNGQSLTGEALQSLYQMIEHDNWEKHTLPGKYTTKNLLSPYLDQLLTPLSLARPIRVAVADQDPIVGKMAVTFLKMLGCEVLPLSEWTGFPQSKIQPELLDPAEPENLNTLKACVAANAVDLAIALDGDGDRLGVLDELGHWIPQDRLLMLFAKALLKNAPGETILYDVKCTHLLDDWIKSHGGHPLMCRTGHSYMERALRSKKAALAGELSGHFYFKDHMGGFDDGFYAAGVFVALLAAQQQSCHVLTQQLPQGFASPTIKIPLSTNDGPAFMSALEKIIDAARVHVLKVDGLRVTFEDGWGLVRLSHTEAKLVCRFEGATKAALQKIKQQFKTWIQSIETNFGNFF